MTTNLVFRDFEGATWTMTAQTTKSKFLSLDHGYFIYNGIRSSAIYDRFGRVVDLSVTAGAEWKNISAPTTQIEWHQTQGLTSGSEEPHVYLGDFHHHFGHFLLETLPNFWAFEYFTELFNGKVKFIFASIDDKNSLLNRDFVSSCLQALSVDTSKIELLNSSKSFSQLICIEQGLKPFGRFGPAEIYNPSAISVFKNIHSFFINNTASNKHRVYLSRRLLYGGNSARKVSNEEEVEQLFIRHGFQIVYPEKLHFDEQVKLIANTAVLAGFEGSAMHLSGFLPEGATTLLICKHPEPSNQNAFNNLSNSSLIVIPRENYILRKGKRKIHFNKERFRFEKAKRGIVFDTKKLDSFLSEQNFFSSTN